MDRRYLLQQKLYTVLSCFFCTALLLSLLAVPCRAWEPSRTIRIGYNDYSGFIDQREDGTYWGYAVDYLNALAQYTGWQYEFISGTFAELMEKTASGEIDLLCQTQKTSEREQTFLFSDHEVGTEIAALYVSDTDKDRYYYEDAESMDGMRVAMLSKSAQNDVFSLYAAEQGFSYEPVYFTTVKECEQALSSGQVDSIIMGSLAGQDMEGVCLAGRLSSDPYYIMCNKENVALMDEVNQAQEQLLLKDPYIVARLFDKYYASTTAFSAVLYTRTEAEYLAKAPMLTIALRQNALPLSNFDTQSDACGILPDITKRITDRAGLPVTYDAFDTKLSPRGYLQANPDHAVISAFSGQSKQQGMITSESIYNSYAALVGRKNSSDYSADKSSTARYAILSGNPVLYTYLEAQYPQAKILQYDTVADCLHAVQSGHADYAAYTLNLLRNALENPHYRDLSIYSTNFMPESYRIAMLDTPENEILIDILNKCIHALPDALSEQIEINHVINDAYQQTVWDAIYLYRMPLLIICGLVLICFVLLLSMNAQRARSLSLLQLQNDKLAQSAIELRHAVHTAERANAAKSDFLARMSHDIRTPLNAVLGYAGLIHETEGLPEHVLQDVARIQSSGRFLLDLVNDVLDMSKIEAGEVTFVRTALVMQTFAETIPALLQPTFDAKGVSLKVEISDAVPALYLDTLRFQRILLNLLSNAVKFTPSGGHVRLTLDGTAISETEFNCQLTVSDDGAGMSEAFQSHLFEPFTQEHASASGMEGSGLGLAITHRLVTLAGGTISVSSKLGEGTTFTVRLPCRIAPTPVSSPTAHREQDAQSLHGKRILLCEDHAVNAELVRRLLLRAEITVDRVENGAEGVMLFCSSAPYTYNAILMDIRMPVMDGIEATRRIRAAERPDAKTIPIVALTANAYDADRRQSKEAGMNEHLSKPINPAQLYHTLAQLLS